MDTIFSSASNSQKSAIKIIRVSGKLCNKIPHIFSFKQPSPRIASLRKIYDLNKNLIDNALVIFFPGPSTVTGEDIYEIHIHGSFIIEKKIYKILSEKNGFRTAEPGEFTKRAFLNGVVDLTQAEGLNDLINAETETQFKLSMSQYQGVLFQKLEAWRKDIIYLLSKLEALIDFSDEELPPDTENIFNQKLLKLLKEMKDSIKFSGYGERLRSGFVVTLIGRPNVGKSSLINFLSKRKVAIVTNEAGTTRDVLEVALDFEGYPVILNDTAGIRVSVSNIEKIGIERAIKKANNSDIILILSDDGNFNFPEIKSFSKKILIHTKSDLKVIPRKNVHPISVKQNKGIDHLIKLIVKHLQSFAPKENTLLNNQRHIQGVKKALLALKRVSTVDLNVNPELAAEDLRVAASCIGSITNMIDVEEILDDIFSKFCIGK